MANGRSNRWNGLPVGYRRAGRKLIRKLIHGVFPCGGGSYVEQVKRGGKKKKEKVDCSGDLHECLDEPI